MIDLLLYTRRDCCLCDAMKDVVEDAARNFPTRLSLVDVDSRPELAREYGEEVPVLFVNGRKFAKYRADPRRLRSRLSAENARTIAGG
jgi:glutaredoxin